MASITYVCNGLTHVVDYTGVSGKIVLEKNPLLIPNKRVLSYSGSDSHIYYPLQLIDVPQNNITLTASMANASLVQVWNGNTINDISDMVLNVVQKKGKNQPFSYIVLTVSRQLFIEENIEMVQKSTEFVLDIYGITGRWIYERLEDNGSYYEITLVNRAYYLKNMTLLSLFNFIPVTVNKVTFTNIVNSNGTPIFSNRTITWGGTDDNEGTFSISFDSRQLVFKIKRNIYSVDGVEKRDYSLTKIFECNPDDLFYFLARYVAGYTQSTIMISPGYYYNVPNLMTIPDTYTMDEIENLKNGARNVISNQTPLLKTVSLRLDEYCWDTLQSLAYLSNREIMFDTWAYFKPFTPSNTKLSIDWEPPTTPLSGVTYVTTMALCENDDQGSQYLTASQKVISEAYETSIAISDTNSTYVGQDIKYLAVDDTGSSGADPNSNRNAQAKIVALNALIKNFKPGDCIEYSVNETVMPTPDKTISSWDQFNTITNADDCFLFQTTIPNTSVIATETYYVKKSNIWFEYDTDNPSRAAGYDVDACVASITDAHNNITLTNVSLALKTVEYPACVTTYTWGNPEFMDEQSQFNSLSAVSQDSVLDNTSDTGISSGDATKLVVGNQYVHQLRDDRAGFTGLIMEKNNDNNVYRLVGYNQGQIQAQFNSAGMIEAGGGSVLLNANGVGIYNNSSHNAQLDSNGLTVFYDNSQYRAQDALKFKNRLNNHIPYRLFATYDGNSTSGTTISHVQAISEGNFSAELEMLCDDGGATTTTVPFSETGSYTLDANQTKIFTLPANTGNTPTVCHAVFIGATNDNDVTGSISMSIGLSNNNNYSFRTPEPGYTIGVSYYPETIKTIRFTNTGSSQITLDMSKWSMYYSTSSGKGASLTMAGAGSEMRGDLKVNGNLSQMGGSPIFYGPDGHTTGAVSALTPAQFYMPVVSYYKMVAPTLIGGSVEGSVVYSGGNGSLNSYQCRNIAILTSNQSRPSNPHTGDIIFRI